MSGTNRDVDVTVEREPSTEDEDAVKGTNTATTEVGTAEGDASEATADTAVETDADDDTETDVDDEAAPETTVDAPAEDEPVIDEAEPAGEDDEEAAESDDEDGDVSDDDEPDAAVEGSDDPVTEIKGIGPAYAERLADIGIETVGDLAAADPADIAAETDLSESRVAGWVERAAAY